MPLTTIYFSNGWRSFLLDQPLTVQYNSAGEKEVVLRLDYAGISRYSHSKFHILPSTANGRNSGALWPQNLYETFHTTASESYLGDSAGATLHIFYNTSNCNSVANDLSANCG